NIYPINPKADKILGLKAYKSIKDVPDEVDLAVIVIPARIVPLVMEECASASVKGVIIISAGFSEIGAEGRKLEDEVMRIARKNGIRVVGPNCQGIINMTSNLIAWFGPVPKKRGPVAFITQSGAYGGSLISWTNKLRMKFFNIVVSIGNKCDVDEAELISFLAQNETVKVIALYLEGVKNGRKFMEAARDASKIKPIVVLRAGRSPEGARAIASHTGSLAGKDEIYNAAFKQAGIVRVNTTEELLDSSLALAAEHHAPGNNIVIITNAGGPGAIATDICYEYNIKLLKFSEKTVSELRKVLPPQCAVENPIDVTGDPRPERFDLALKIVFENEDPSGVIFIVIGPLRGGEEVAKIILKYRRMYRKPFVVCWLAREYAGRGPAMVKRAGIPIYDTPERAVTAMAALVKYGTYLRRKR
ncbi:MAG: CoA-binding protein, partial [Candidatus Methanomethylicota archaeon]